MDLQKVNLLTFNNSNLIFVDILATVSGASFAIDDQGDCYRWGLNQVFETQYPVYDRYDGIMNYTNLNCNFKQADPLKI